jgi:hypothetical protein
MTVGRVCEEVFADVVIGRDAVVPLLVYLVQALLDKYAREGPVIVREAEVTKAINDFKSHSELHHLSTVPLALLTLGCSACSLKC